LLPEPASAVVQASAPAEAAASSATVVAEQASAPMESPSSVRPVVPAPPVSLPEPEATPGFLESLNPMVLAGGGAALALVVGAGFYLRSRRQKDTGETSFLESRLQPDSFFGASGGQRVDTRDATGGPSSMSYSLSQLDAIGDVDPVAEADVYLAYGRDLQAEEILKEALRTTPERLAVRTKLLEVYAKRRDTKGYEQLAVQLYNLTHGDGEDWAKAQEMGLGIDPENPLYQPGGQPSSSGAAGEAAHDYLGATTVPHSTMPTPTTLGSTLPMATAEEAAAAENRDNVPSELVDLDLDLTAPAPLDEEVSDSVSPTSVSGDLPPLDLPDLSPAEARAAQTAETAPMGLPQLDTQPAKGEGLDFDLSVDEPAKPASVAKPEFDLNSISLDLDDAKPSQPAQDWTEATSVSPQEMPTDPMARKFELAEEFRQIGDVDGARELLQEVIENSQDGALKSKAQTMLDSLS
jgi:pilus assembly protein FimV